MHHIYFDLFIQAPKAAIFQAVSSPEHLVNWWPQRCSGEAREGASYNFFFTPEYDWHGEVITCRPNEAFHIKMTSSDADWDPTSFGFDLEELAEGIRLKFWHRDWPELNHHYRRSAFCWAMLLNGLKNYVEKGEIVPFEDRE